MNSRERAASHALRPPLTDGTYGRMADKSPFSGGGDAVLAGSPCLNGGVTPSSDKRGSNFIQNRNETVGNRRAPDRPAESHPAASWSALARALDRGSDIMPKVAIGQIPRGRATAVGESAPRQPEPCPVRRTSTAYRRADGRRALPRTRRASRTLTSRGRPVSGTEPVLPYMRGTITPSRNPRCSGCARRRA
jgi:hypothetical protein